MSSVMPRPYAMTAGLPRVITSVRSLLPLRRCDRFYTAAAYADCSHDFAVEPQRDAAWEGDQEETGHHGGHVGSKFPTGAEFSNELRLSHTQISDRWRGF
jgi:hypothetical protein